MQFYGFSAAQSYLLKLRDFISQHWATFESLQQATVRKFTIDPGPAQTEQACTTLGHAVEDFALPSVTTTYASLQGVNSGDYAPSDVFFEGASRATTAYIPSPMPLSLYILFGVLACLMCLLLVYLVKLGQRAFFLEAEIIKHLRVSLAADTAASKSNSDQIAQPDPLESCSANEPEVRAAKEELIAWQRKELSGSWKTIGLLVNVLDRLTGRDTAGVSPPALSPDTSCRCRRTTRRSVTFRSSTTSARNISSNSIFGGARVAEHEAASTSHNEVEAPSAQPVAGPSRPIAARTGTVAPTVFSELPFVEENTQPEEGLVGARTAFFENGVSLGI